jgi:hypothetical protein
MPRGHNPFVGDEQDVPSTQLAREFSHALESVWAENDPRARLIIKLFQPGNRAGVLRSGVHGQEGRVSGPGFKSVRVMMKSSMTNRVYHARSMERRR